MKKIAVLFAIVALGFGMMFSSSCGKKDPYKVNPYTIPIDTSKGTQKNPSGPPRTATFNIFIQDSTAIGTDLIATICIYRALDTLDTAYNHGAILLDCINNPGTGTVTSGTPNPSATFTLPAATSPATTTYWIWVSAVDPNNPSETRTGIFQYNVSACNTCVNNPVFTLGKW